MSDARTICDTLGRANIADALGVGLTAVSNAAVSGKFPASWFPAVREMCDAAGVDCPEELFRFKARAAG